MDGYDGNLQEWTTAGVKIAGPVSAYGTATTFKSPNGVGVDPQTGNVYVADQFNDQIAVFDANANYLAAFGGGQFGSGNNPIGGGVNSAGTTVYALSKTSPATIYAYSFTGTTYTYQSASSFALGGVTNPFNICLDNNDNLYVADR